MKLTLFAAFFCLVASAVAQTTPRAGLVINRSTKLTTGEHLVPAPGDERGAAAVLIEGDNITVDFGGATLMGAPMTTDPHERKGVGVEVRGRNVTIRNARIRGYKVGLIARNAPGLKVLGGDLSYNWKQRLRSTPEREDLADWMSYHQNEKDEWLRYGAAIYLRDCDGFEVKGVRIQGGQNGLMITGCDKGLIWNNDFSFNSSLGLGMYRSSDNRIMHNKMDWNLRGFSYGKYNRGQDSAGILIYEQSHRNVFAYNSVTHGGDGFFLWAGQTTMDTGQGGCNDNLLYGNDWSHAPTNGIEATFSRNNFVNNLLLECWHGIWGGYSYESKIIGNVFGYNAEAIAIEHGQDNVIRGNTFIRDNEAVVLWFNDRPQDPNWGYPKHRDTRSRDYTIEGNTFRDVFSNVFRLSNTQGVRIENNTFRSNGTLFKLAGTMANVRFANNSGAGTGAGIEVPPTVTVGTNRLATTGEYARAPLPPASSLNQGATQSTAEYLKRFDVGWNPFAAPLTNSPAAREAQRYAPRPLKGGMNPFLKKGALRGWRYMIVDEWGPYDFKRPLMRPDIGGPASAISGTGRDEKGNELPPYGSATERYEILGPKGRWRVVSLQGATLETQSGTVPGYVDVTTDLYKPGRVKIELEYVGAETTDYRGIVAPAGRPVRFGLDRFSAPINWNVRFFAWDAATDPRTQADAFRTLIAGKPLHEMTTQSLDFSSGGAFYRGGPANNFATVAEGTFQIEPGVYTLDVTTDDGIRVWVDDKLVIESWKYQGPTPYTADVTFTGTGGHKIRVEHFEIDGHSALKVAFRPKG